MSTIKLPETTVAVILAAAITGCASGPSADPNLMPMSGDQIRDTIYADVVTRGNHKGTPWENHNCSNGVTWSNFTGNWVARDWTISEDVTCIQAAGDKKRCYRFYQDVSDANRQVYERLHDSGSTGEQETVPDASASKCTA